jgi:Zn-dependent metalloprotease
MIARRSFHRVLVTLVLLLIFLAASINAPGFASKDLFRVQQVDEPSVRVDYHNETGKLSFLGASPESPIIVQSALMEGLSPEDRAMAVLGVYGSDFGLKSPAQELTLMRVRSNEKGRTSVRYQQVYESIPVLAGELIVNQDSMGRLLSISGEISPALSTSTTPTFLSPDAKKLALEAVAKYYGLSTGDLEATDPELWVFDERLLRPSSRPATLVWRMDVTGIRRTDIRELVLINADFGGIALHFNQVDAALDREIYDNDNDDSLGLPGFGPVRSEGDPATGITDVDLAYDYSGDMYNFFLIEHGRDSLDNAGMTMISTVRYCDPLYTCPFANAFWNGTQMVYGQGYASADDVVGHELTHGVTDYESHLFYFYQSGAINETFSDIWGEFIDLTNGAGDDSPGVRWLMGEDLAAGEIRDMSNPPAFGDPDRTGSGNFWCGTSDNGGVHINSGVANKAAYLLTDGDTFNGYVVTGLGIPKVADLFYEVNTNLMTSGGNFNDLYNALIQASFNLGFSAGERQEVEDAVDATEMDTRPCGDSAEAPLCMGGVSPVDLFFDDLENPGSWIWSSAANVGSNEWYYPQNPNPYQFDATNTSSGIYNFWGYDQPYIADIHIAMTYDVTIPEDAYLHFKHYWDFESEWDGGVVEYSTNGGSSWVDAGSLFTHVGYTGTISSFDNPLGGRQAFVNESRGYTASRLNLSSLAGQNVRFRFRIGTDSSIDNLGWFIDDVRIFVCQTFIDVPQSYWAYQWIEALYNSGITSGCSANPPMYCPDSSVNRAQMAVFLERGMRGSGYNPPAASGTVFNDVPASHWAAAWIEQLAADGITGGCSASPPLYCPGSSVTRAQMAIFLERGMHWPTPFTPPPASGTVFNDVPASHWAVAWIEQLAADGITGGCSASPPMYCPESPVTRAQMAVFLVRTFNLPIP